MSLPRQVFVCLGLITATACGCASTCHDCAGTGRDGRSYAGMKYEACCEHCGGGFECGKCTSGCDSCSGGCDGCAGDGCEGCCKDSERRWFSGRWLRACGLIDCAGCGGERYWSEWHNDPPACCEPCDCHGNYVGPGEAGYYRAPYATPSLAAKSDGDLQTK